MRLQSSQAQEGPGRGVSSSLLEEPRQQHRHSQPGLVSNLGEDSGSGQTWEPGLRFFWSRVELVLEKKMLT